MTLPDFAVIGGHAADIQEAINALDEEFGPVAGSPLYEAIQRDDEEMVRRTSLQVQGLPTLGPKKEAILKGRTDFLKLLLEKDDLIGEEMVAAACDRKDRDSIRILLGYGWPINRPVNFAASLLCIAVNDAQFTQWLIENGADVNARSRHDESALSVAIVRGSMDVVRLLLSYRTDITHGDLLHCAAQRKNQAEGAELVEHLAQKGAVVNAYRFDNPTAFRWRGTFKLPTPLHVACDEGNLPVAQALVRHGADPHRKMLEAGRLTQPTPLDKALESNNGALIDFLRATNLSS